MPDSPEPGQAALDNQMVHEEAGIPVRGVPVYRSPLVYPDLALILVGAQKWLTLLNAIIALLGLWVLVASFVLKYPVTTPRLNNFVLGLVIAALATLRIFVGRHGAWLNWLMTLLALWLTASPFALGYLNSMRPGWNSIAVGIAVALLSASSAIYTLRLLRPPGYGRAQTD